jgi:hypothetical protein
VRIEVNVAAFGFIMDCSLEVMEIRIYGDEWQFLFVHLCADIAYCTNDIPTSFLSCRGYSHVITIIGGNNS